MNKIVLTGEVINAAKEQVIEIIKASEKPQLTVVTCPKTIRGNKFYLSRVYIGNTPVSREVALMGLQDVTGFDGPSFSVAVMNDFKNHDATLFNAMRRFMAEAEETTVEAIYDRCLHLSYLVKLDGDTRNKDKSFRVERE